MLFLDKITSLVDKDNCIDATQSSVSQRTLQNTTCWLLKHYETPVEERLFVACYGCRPTTVKGCKASAI